MRSVLDIGFSTRVPQQNATIPYGYYANGAPFLLYSQGEITSFKIVCLRTRIETELSPTLILGEDGKRYYKATHELGVPRGSYFYKLGIGESSTGEDRLDQSSDPAVCHVLSDKAYGEWEVDFDYTVGGAMQFYIVCNSLDLTPTGDYIRFSMSSNLCIFAGSTGSFMYLDTPTFFPTTGRYKLKFVRNSYEDEFVMGPIATMSMYINGILVDAGVGWTTIIEPLITSSTYIRHRGYGSFPTSGLYSFDGHLPDGFITDFGSFSISLQNTVELGGSTLYSQVFKIDEHMRGPTPEVGDFNSDFDNSFLNFEATGVIDENGDEC